MQPDDKIRLHHMLDSAREAIEFAKGKSRADLTSNRMFVLSVIKSIEIIGEAANKVSPQAQKEVPAIPWQDVIAMRHRLIHTYFDINLDVVWETVHVDLPSLVAALEKILTEDKKTSN